MTALMPSIAVRTGQSAMVDAFRVLMNGLSQGLGMASRYLEWLRVDSTRLHAARDLESS